MNSYLFWSVVAPAILMLASGAAGVFGAARRHQETREQVEARTRETFFASTTPVRPRDPEKELLDTSPLEWVAEAERKAEAQWRREQGERQSDVVKAAWARTAYARPPQEPWEPGMVYTPEEWQRMTRRPSPPAADPGRRGWH